MRRKGESRSYTGSIRACGKNGRRAGADLSMPLSGKPRGGGGRESLQSHRLPRSGKCTASRRSANDSAGGSKPSSCLMFPASVSRKRASAFRSRNAVSRSMARMSARASSEKMTRFATKNLILPAGAFPPSSQGRPASNRNRPAPLPWEPRHFWPANQRPPV